MQKTLLLLFLIFFLAYGGSVFAEEKIDHYDVDITINTDASVDIVETIEYNFGSQKRHGIFRDIPVKYKTDKNINRNVHIEGITVHNAHGKEYTFKKEKNGRDLRIKIGDADRYVRGIQTYVISYTVNGAMNYFDTHDEFYWNINGLRWDVPIEDISVAVVGAEIDRATCFIGKRGSKKNCLKTPSDELLQKESVVTSADFAHNQLAAHENMSVVVGMPAGTVVKPTFLQNLLSFIIANGIILTPIAVLVYMFRHWWIKGKDPKGRGTIVAQSQNSLCFDQNVFHTLRITKFV